MGRAETDSYGWIEVSSGNVTYCVCHGHYRETKSQRNAKQTDTHLGKRSSQDRASAATKN